MNKVSALKSVAPAQQLVKIVHDELVAMLGERREGLRLSSVPPTIVMLVGLQGSGKTTTAAEFAQASGVKVQWVPGGHSWMLARPQGQAEVLRYLERGNQFLEMIDERWRQLDARPGMPGVRTRPPTMRIVG